MKIARRISPALEPGLFVPGASASVARMERSEIRDHASRGSRPRISLRPMIRHPEWSIVAVVAFFPPWQSRKQEEPFNAKVHADFDGSGARAGSDGPTGRRATADVRSTEPPCAQERNSDHQKDKLRRNNRLLRVWPGLDQCVRSPLLQMHPLLASEMIVAGFCARPNFGIS